MKANVGTGYLLNRAEGGACSCVETMLQLHGLTPLQFLGSFRHADNPASRARSSPAKWREVAVDFIHRSAPGLWRVLRIDVSPKGKAVLDRCVPLTQELERELVVNFDPK